MKSAVVIGLLFLLTWGFDEVGEHKVQTVKDLEEISSDNTTELVDADQVMELEFMKMIEEY